MTKADQYFVADVENILRNGFADLNPRPRWHDGIPAHTLSVNHNVRQYDLDKGEFPILTLRPIAWKSAIKEIYWIYNMQSSKLDDLHTLGVKYWDDWESKDYPGTIGHRYGYVVKKYNLMNNLLKELVNDPFGRRHIIDLYQYEDFDMSDGLYPCAFLTDWNVRVKNGLYYLDMILFQRSGDMITASGAGGVNEVQYATLLMMVAKHCGCEPGVFTHVVANEQIYDRHIPAAEDLIRRTPSLKVPQMKISGTNFFNMTVDDCELVDYEPKKPQIKLEVAV